MTGTDKLCMALYGRPAQPRDYLGGSDAKMLHDAAEVIAALAKLLDCDGDVVLSDFDFKFNNPPEVHDGR